MASPVTTSSLAPASTSGAGAAALAAVRKPVECNALTHARVIVRVKPMAAEPGGGTTGVTSSKAVKDIDEAGCSVTVGNSSGAGGTAFSYPFAVAGPDASQSEVYSKSLPDLVEAFVQGYNVNYLAFGQTGSGKTHTIFGPRGSMVKAAKDLAGVSLDDDWRSCLDDNCGMMVRVALEVMEAAKKREEAGVCRSVLTGSMVELSWGAPGDLLNKKAPCSLDEEHNLVGASRCTLRKPVDAARLAVAVESRTTNGTRMNDESSRTHCVTVLVLTQRWLDSDTVTESRFNIVDMMGSERSKGPNSAHDPTKNNKDWEANGTGGIEAIYANWSLHQLGVCAARVAEMNRCKGKAGKAGKAGKKGKKGRSTGKGKGQGHVPFKATPLTRFLAGSLVGHSLTGMVVTLSQAPRNGSESYNSLVYGKDMAKLATVVRPQPQVAFDKLVKQAASELRASKAALGRTSVQKYVDIRRNQVMKWAELLDTLEALQDSSSSSSSSSSGGSGSESRHK